MTDRDAARDWARKLLADTFVILDTETTGLETDAEIVQLAVIDPTGAALMDTLVKPSRPIPQIATSIHGITDAMVADAPTFADIYNQLLMTVGGMRCVIYNADYDVRLLHQSEQFCSHFAPSCLGMDGWRGLAVWEDAMHPYSVWVGDWSDYHGNYRWQRLPGGDHSALGDARACLATIRRMAGVLNSQVTVAAMDDELRGYNDNYSKFYKDRDYTTSHDAPLDAALSAFIADLVDGYSDRSGSRERQRLAHDWLDQWRRDLGWRPIFEARTAKEESQ